MRDDSTIFLTTVVALVLAAIIGVLLLSSHISSDRQVFCTKTYGSNYFYVDGNRGASFCANDKGEVRYPRHW